MVVKMNTLDDLVFIQNELFSINDTNYNNVRDRILDLPHKLRIEMFPSVIDHLRGGKLLGRLISCIQYDILVESTVATPFQLAYQAGCVDQVRSLLPIECLEDPYGVSLLSEQLDFVMEFTASPLLNLIADIWPKEDPHDFAIADRKYLRRLADSGTQHDSWGIFAQLGTSECLWLLETHQLDPEPECWDEMRRVWELRNFRCLKACEVLGIDLSQRNSICQWAFAFLNFVDSSCFQTFIPAIWLLQDERAVRRIYEAGAKPEINLLCDYSGLVPSGVWRILLEVGCLAGPVNSRELLSLIFLSRFCSAETLEVFIEAGVDVSVRGDGLFPPLLQAIKAGRVDLVRVLLSAGASVDVVWGDESALTVVWDPDIAAELLNSGASQRLVDSKGRTAYELARENCHVEICDLLARFSPSQLEQ